MSNVTNNFESSTELLMILSKLIFNFEQIFRYQSVYTHQVTEL